MFNIQHSFSPIQHFCILNAGASVDLVAHFAGDTLKYNTIYTFSLGSSLGDMWNACALVLGNRKDNRKAVVLVVVQIFFFFRLSNTHFVLFFESSATLIGSFSGAWPYIKLLLMICVWTAKPSWLSSRKRGGLMVTKDLMQFSSLSRI